MVGAALAVCQSALLVAVFARAARAGSIPGSISQAGVGLSAGPGFGAGAGSRRYEDQNGKNESERAVHPGHLESPFAVPVSPPYSYHENPRPGRRGPFAGVPGYGSSAEPGPRSIEPRRVSRLQAATARGHSDPEGRAAGRRSTVLSGRGRIFHHTVRDPRKTLLNKRNGVFGCAFFSCFLVRVD
jgi:hypothetical protein